MESIVKMLQDNEDYQKALEAAPDENRTAVEQKNLEIAQQMDELAAVLREIARDPALRAEFRQRLVEELREQKGVTRGS